MVDVPGERGHGSVLGVHNRVLQDVDGVGDIGWEEVLCPARHTVGLGQEPPGEQLVVRRHLPVHYVFSQDMFARTGRGKKTSDPARAKPPSRGWEPPGAAWGQGEESCGFKGEGEPAPRERPVRSTHPKGSGGPGPAGTGKGLAGGRAPSRGVSAGEGEGGRRAAGRSRGMGGQAPTHL